MVTDGYSIVEPFFTESDYYTGPGITRDLVLHAERSLGVSLPAVYVRLLSEKNGGVPRRRCFRTDFVNSWAPDYIEVSAIRGVAGRWGIDSNLGSRYEIAEWGYPDIGVVICQMPSGGHDTVMLDYAFHGQAEEPRVAYIDEDRIPRIIAQSFENFIAQLQFCDEIR